MLGGSFALLIDGQMVYKQVPLLFPLFLSFDTSPNSMFLNLFFGHKTIECQLKDSLTLIRATVWLIAQEHPTSMIKIFAHHGKKTKTIKTCCFSRYVSRYRQIAGEGLCADANGREGTARPVSKPFQLISSSMSSPVSQFQINFQEICWWGKLGRHKSPL